MPENSKRYSKDNKMRDLVGDNAMLLPAISRFDIAFGFGDDTVREVCRANDVDTDTFLCVCNLLSGYDYDSSGISLSSLMCYLKRAHSSFLDVELPKIKHFLIEAINYNDTDEVALLLMRFFDEYVVEVRRHMENENDVIFEYVARLLEGVVDDGFNIAQYSAGHGDTVTKLNELKDIFIYHYKQRDNARLSGTLLDIIICGRDMMSHFDIETKLFIPAVERLENRLRSSLLSDNQAGGDTSGDETGPITLLSEREKEIVRKIAQGRVNKEIADELCISVHTVATHRRNISSKLEIHTAAGLTVFAIINHLVELDEVKPS